MLALPGADEAPLRHTFTASALVTELSLVPCPGCGGRFLNGNGPVHRYMESSPGCWAAYGDVIAREYSESALADVHRLSVDSYAAQHPGRPSPQSMKSVGVHLIRLCLTVEREFDVRESNRIMRLEGEGPVWLARTAAVSQER